MKSIQQAHFHIGSKFSFEKQESQLENISHYVKSRSKLIELVKMERNNYYQKEINKFQNSNNM
jgi:hypothetical protein